MLNYINKSVYLPKMLQLKCGVWEFGVFCVLVVYGEVCGTIGMKKESTPTWDNIYHDVIYTFKCPHINCPEEYIE